MHDVWKILDNGHSIRKELDRGLINHSALARYIIEEKKVDATLDAVLSAIRRYKFTSHDDVFNSATKSLKKTINVSTRSNLAEISLVKDDDVQKVLPKLFDIIKYIQGDVLRVTQANECIRLLIDEKNIENVAVLFPKNKILTEDKSLAEINIYIHPKMQTTPGILAVLTNELAMSGINIVEIMTCPPEMICVVKKRDLIKATDVIYLLCDNIE